MRLRIVAGVHASLLLCAAWLPWPRRPPSWTKSGNARRAHLGGAVRHGGVLRKRANSVSMYSKAELKRPFCDRRRGRGARLTSPLLPRN